MQLKWNIIRQSNMKLAKGIDANLEDQNSGNLGFVGFIQLKLIAPLYHLKERFGV